MSINTKVINTYAKSLFQSTVSKTAQQKNTNSFKISKITSVNKENSAKDAFISGEELSLIGSLISSSNSMKGFFKNPTYIEQDKLEIILDLFPGITLSTKSFLKVLAEKNHLSLIPLISEEYNKILLKIQNIIKVKIITASALDESLSSKILTTLKKLTSAQEIILSVAYNPKLLGGLVIEYKSVAIDASILKEFSFFFSEI
jgi:F-type H+-transporting ATPase subunit delta